LRNFYFFKLKEKVIAHVKACLSCAKTQRVTKRDNVPIKSYSRSMQSFDVVAIDCMGPLDTTKRGHKYILGFIDLATGWIEMLPLKTLKPTEVLSGVMRWISVAGVPAVLISDNSVNLNSKLTEEIYKFLRLEHRNSTPYHSMGNSLVERSFGTMKKLLSSLTLSQYSRDWDLYLPYLLWCHRSVPNEMSEYSAFELLYGHEARCPVDVLYDLWTDNEFQYPLLPKRDEAFFKDIQTKIESSIRDATSNRNKNLQPYLDRYNVSARVKQFQVGDSVLILMPDSTAKLRARWRGPAVISRVVSSNSYMVYDPQNESTRCLHANKLRKYEAQVSLIGMIEDSDDDFGEIIEYPINFSDSDKDKFEETLSKLDLSHLSQDQVDRLKKLLRKHQKIFSQSPGSVDPSICTMEIKVKPGTIPKRQQPYRIPEKLKPVVEEQLRDLVKMGILKESHSDYAHPIVLVQKSDGSLRMCGNFKEVNKAIIPDKYPMRRIDELCQSVAGSTFITSLDAVKGYYQIAIHPDSQKYTAITTHCGTFEHLKAPFGIINSAAEFQRCMDRILRNDQEYAKAYIDDVCCFSELDFNDHLEKLDRVFCSIGNAGMTLKLSKCSFAKPRVKFLGFVVGSGKISPNPDKLKVICEMKEPNSKKEIRSFLAMCRFYMRHLANFSELAVPLTDLTKNSVRGVFQLNDKQRQTFEMLKDKIREAQDLFKPDYNKEFYLACDTSNFAIASCLSQKDKFGDMQPVEFVSKKLSGSQLNWSTVIKEAYSILYALQRFDHYLIGGSVIILSDSSPLQYLKNCTPSSPKLERWLLSLSRWQQVIKFEPGISNPSDYLSRHP